MAAFTEEQITILEAMFDHMWARMASLHDDLNEDSVRLAALIGLLREKGAITQEQVMAIVKILSIEATEQRPLAAPSDQTEQAITRRILRGDLSARGRVSKEKEG